MPIINFKQGFNYLARCAGCCSVPREWWRLKEMLRSAAGSRSLPGQGQGDQAGRPWRFLSTQKFIFGVVTGGREVKS